MSLSTLLNRTCWVVTRSGSGDADSYYGSESSETAETAVETVCEVQQQRRDEAEDQGELSESHWLGVFPAGTALDSASAVVVEGLGEFELVGAPWPARNPRTQAESHVEATLVRTAGPEDIAS